MSETTMVDHEQLEFEGERVFRSQVKVKGEIALGDDQALGRGQRFHVVGSGAVDGISFADVKGALTRQHAASLTKSVMVERDLIDDILVEQEELETGQMRLLTITGETRRATRHVFQERRRGIEELGLGAEHLDAKDELKGALDFTDYVTTHQFKEIDKLVELVDTESPELPEWYSDLEHELMQAATVCVAGMEWARRRRNAALIAQGAIDEAMSALEVESDEHVDDADDKTGGDEGHGLL